MAANAGALRPSPGSWVACTEGGCWESLGSRPGSADVVAVGVGRQRWLRSRTAEPRCRAERGERCSLVGRVRMLLPRGSAGFGRHLRWSLKWFGNLQPCPGVAVPALLLADRPGSGVAGAGGAAAGQSRADLLKARHGGATVRPATAHRCPGGSPGRPLAALR